MSLFFLFNNLHTWQAQEEGEQCKEDTAKENKLIIKTPGHTTKPNIQPQQSTPKDIMI